MTLKQPELYNFKVETITGQETTLSNYEGKVLLIVNVASKCGLTPQYEALEKVYEQYQDKGFEVLGFPANDFGAQEPGTNAEIQEFCNLNYSVKFPLFAKIAVKGSNQHPLYQYLTETKPVATQNPGSQLDASGSGVGHKSSGILWNFEKFLVNRHGEVVERFAPDVVPDASVVTQAIETELANS